MTTGTTHRLAGSSKLALGLAVGTSAVVGAAAMTGSGLTALEVVGAFGVAGVIGILSARGSRPTAQPFTLVAVPDRSEGAVVAAPRAASLVAHPAYHHSDAA